LFVEGGQVAAQKFLEFVEIRVRLRGQVFAYLLLLPGGRAVALFDGAFQGGQFVVELDGEVEGVFAGLSFV
jgi:hypothetical protein